MENVSKALYSAVLKSALGKYSVYIFQVLSMVVLARLFSPEDFGVIASIQVFVLFCQLIVTNGLAPAVIYREKIAPSERDGLFSFSVLLGCLLALIYYLFIDILYDWYGFEYGKNAFYIVIGCIIFSALSMVPLASLQKDTKFYSIAIAEALTELLSFLVCILFYYWGYGLLAIAIRLLCVSLFRFLFYYLFSKQTEVGLAKFGTKIDSIKYYFGFAKFQVSFNVLNFFSRNLDNILIAKYLGAGVLGGYEKVYQLMRYPLQLFTFAITPALQPVLTKYKDDPSVIEKAFYDIAFKLCFAGLMVTLALQFVADEVVYLFFGSQWGDVGALLAILAVSIPLQMVLSSTGGIYQAVGKVKFQFYCGVFSSVVNVAAIVLGIYYSDIELLCQALIFAFAINFFQCFWLLHRRVFMSFNIWKFLTLVLYLAIPYIIHVFGVTEFISLGNSIDTLSVFIICAAAGGVSFMFAAILWVVHSKFINKLI